MSSSRKHKHHSRHHHHHSKSHSEEARALHELTEVLSDEAAAAAAAAARVAEEEYSYSYESDSSEDDVESLIWETWNTLDSHDEHSAIRSHATLKPLVGLIKARTSSRKGKRAQKRTVPESYTGPRLPDPLTLDSVIRMIDAFRDGSKLHYVYAEWLLERVTHVLREQSTIQDIPVEHTVTVVGDIHGQLRDMLKIFSLNGYPSSENVYLFNGDFVDRGDQGCEVFFILAAFVVLNPRSVFLNRGNHETLEMNQTYGFMREVRHKYDSHLFRKFQDAFCALPLGAVIGSKVMVVHGGLFHHMSMPLSVLRKIRRNIQPELGSDATVEDQIMEDLLWSDPQDLPGITPNRQRGAGSLFGPDITERFLDANNLSLLIRSHEMKERGYEVAHGGLLATIFSASNYNGSQNYGAYGVINPALEVKMKKYSTVSAEEVPPPEETTSILMEAVQNRIYDLICQHRVELVWFYDALDTQRRGTITPRQWAQGLRYVLQLDLPWTKLQNIIVDADCFERRRIQYVRFLEKNKIDSGLEDFGDAVIKKVNQKLYETCGTAEAAFSLFDADGDGNITCREFAIALSHLDIGLNDKQIYEFMRSIDNDMDNNVSLPEFMERFQVVFTDEGTDDDWARDVVTKIGQRLFQQDGNLEDLFQQFDEDGNGNISMDEFISAIRSLGFEYSDDQNDRLMRFVDTDASGQMSYEEFVNAFAIIDTKDTTHWQANIMQQISGVLFKNKDHLQRMCNIFDADDTGAIPPEDFRVGLGTLNELLSSPLTDMQIDVLLDKLPKDADGHVIYQGFLDDLRVVRSD